MDCKGCDPELRLPSCDSDADCNGGTCAATSPSPGSPRGAKHKVCLGHSDALVLQFHDLIATAQRRVDIALLAPAPDTRFLGALREALETLAGRGRPITVRIIVGHYPSADVDAAAFVKALTSGLEGMPKARLSVSVAAMRSCVVFEDCDSYSWNHAKIVTVDGVDALVGGHNMWSADYLIDDPVHDLSMRVHGAGRGQRSALYRPAMGLCLRQYRQEGLDQRGEFCRRHEPAGERLRARRHRPCRLSGRLAACRSWRSRAWGRGSPRTSPTRASSRAI